MSAFDTAWALTKFRIPEIDERSVREATIEENAKHPGRSHWGSGSKPLHWTYGEDGDRTIPFPDEPAPPRNQSRPSFGGQDITSHSYKSPQALGTSDRNSRNSAIHYEPIIEQVTDMSRRYPAERKLTNEEIERIIEEMTTTGHHEAIHMALDTIFPYEGFHDHDSTYDYKFPNYPTGVSRDKFIQAHEYGAITGSAKNRLDAIRQMARHPAFSGQANMRRDDAISLNPHAERQREYYDKTEQEIAEMFGNRARENARGRME